MAVQLDDAYSLTPFAAKEDPYRGRRMSWLTDAVASSYDAMRRFRMLNRSLVEAYAGPAYIDLDRAPRYLQKLADAVDAYQTLLIGGSPRVMIDTHLKELDPFATAYQASLNQLGTEIHLRETIEQWVVDACLLLGVVKVHIADSGNAMFADGLSIDPGVPNASNVSLDDWVVDMTAKNYRAAKFAGDKYRIPYAEFQRGIDLGVYDETVAKDVQPSSRRGSVDDSVASRVRSGETVDPDELEPMVDLCDVWVQRDGKIYTFAVRDGSGDRLSLDPRPLATMDWRDAESGPYLLLGFRRVPDAIFPKSPAVHLYDLSTLIDNIMSLTARQAKRQKTLTVHPPGSEVEAGRVRTAPDGAMICASDPSAVKPYVVPGADPGSVNYLLQLQQFFDTGAGNLTALMGLGVQSGTVGQETLIHQAGNRKVAWMQDRVVTATSRLYRSLGFLLWHDEFKEITTRLPIPGAESYTATIQWTADERAGNFFDYNFRVSSSSIMGTSPQQEAQAIGQIVVEQFIPLAEMAAQQGVRIDIAELAAMYAELLDKPRLRKIVVADGQPGQRGPSTGVRKPPTSTRHYVRHNTGGQGSNAQSRLSNYFASQPSLSRQQNIQNGPA